MGSELPYKVLTRLSGAMKGSLQSEVDCPVVGPMVILEKTATSMLHEQQQVLWEQFAFTSILLVASEFSLILKQILLSSSYLSNVIVNHDQTEVNSPAQLRNVFMHKLCDNSPSLDIRQVCNRCLGCPTSSREPGPCAVAPEVRG